MPPLPPHPAAFWERWLPARSTARLVPWRTVRDSPGPVLADVDRLRAQGSHPGAAARFVTAWTAGALAEVVGRTLAIADAALVVSGDTALLRHPGGWSDGVVPHAAGPADVRVAATHPWWGATGTAAPRTDVVEDAVTALVQQCRPVVEAIAGHVRISASGLWQEVADALVGGVLLQPGLRLDEAARARLRAAVGGPERPWPRTPEVAVSEEGPEDGVGDVVGRRGGCCLAFTTPTAPFDATRIGDPLLRDWYARFPLEAPGRQYCSSCSLRTTDDAHTRQRFWLAQRRT